MMKAKYHLSIFLIALFAGLMGFVTDVGAKKTSTYSIRIGGVQVTSKNASNITGPHITGKVSFDINTRTLTLNNATIDGGDISSIFYYYPGNGKMNPPDGIIIRLQGNNTLKSRVEEAIYANASLRITGGGSLTIESGNMAISVGYRHKNDLNLTIDGCTLTANRGIYVKGSLQINNSNVHVKCPNDSHLFNALNINLSGCKIVRPVRGKIKCYNGTRYTVVTESGQLCGEIRISTGSDPEQPAKFTLTPSELNVDANYHHQTVELSCDEQFEVTRLDNLDWAIIVSNKPGMHYSQTHRIVIHKNTGAERTGTITFKTTEGEATLHVTQEAKSTAPPTLTLTPTTLTFAASGGASQSVAVKSSVEGWGVKLKDRTQDWLTVTPDAAAKTVTVTVKPNTGTKKRSAEVEVVSDAGLTRSF
ncbi:hypothetical protein BHU09_04390, partial [Tannerella sp. oral taxon 808]